MFLLYELTHGLAYLVFKYQFCLTVTVLVIETKLLIIQDQISLSSSQLSYLTSLTYSFRGEIIYYTESNLIVKSIQTISYIYFKNIFKFVWGKYVFSTLNNVLSTLAKAFSPSDWLTKLTNSNANLIVKIQYSNNNLYLSSPIGNPL